jgi:hypothetical protein
MDTDKIGTIGVCCHCGYACQLRLFRWRDPETGQPVEGSWWEHFVCTMFTAHVAAPKRSIRDRVR